MLIPPILFLLCSLTTAQQITDGTSSFQTDSSSDPARNSLSASFMNITFSSSNQPICSSSPSNSSSNSSSSALSIAIRTLPQTRACLDLTETFSNPSTTYTSDGTGRCDSQLGLCGVKYTVFQSLPDQKDINNGNWDNIFYTQVRNPLDGQGRDEGDGSGGRLELEVFNSEGCEMKGKGESRKWSCVDSGGSCGGVGYGVKSFRVGLVDAQEVGVGGCAVGASSGAESSMGRMSGLATMVIVGVFGTAALGGLM